MIRKTKPPCCPDGHCKCIASVGDVGEPFEFGKSYECIGKPESVDIYIAGSTVHDNDLSHCIWTPRGWTRYWVNNEDLAMVAELAIEAALKNGINPTYIGHRVELPFKRFEAKKGEENNSDGDNGGMQTRQHENLLSHRQQRLQVPDLLQG